MIGQNFLVISLDHFASISLGDGLEDQMYGFGDFLGDESVYLSKVWYQQARKFDCDENMNSKICKLKVLFSSKYNFYHITCLANMYLYTYVMYVATLPPSCEKGENTCSLSAIALCIRN